MLFWSKIGNLPRAWQEHQSRPAAAEHQPRMGRSHIGETGQPPPPPLGEALVATMVATVRVASLKGVAAFDAAPWALCLARAKRLACPGLQNGGLDGLMCASPLGQGNLVVAVATRWALGRIDHAPKAGSKSGFGVAPRKACRRA